MIKRILAIVLLLTITEVSYAADPLFKDLIIPKDGSGAKYSAMVGYNTVNGAWQFLQTKKLADGTFVLDLGTVSVAVEGQIPSIGAVVSIINTVWSTAPPTKQYEVILTVPPLATASTTFTIGTPIVGYRAFVEYVNIIRDEASPIDYMNIQLIDVINDKLMIGGEIAPAGSLPCLRPTTPLIATDCKLLIWNKCGTVQRIKVSVIVSVQKVTDYVYAQPSY